MFSSLPLIIEPDQLFSLIHEPDLLIIDVCQPALYQHLHIPGAVHISPAELVSGQPPATGKLPSTEILEKLFSRIGLSPDKYVVAYDDEGGGWAGRLLWTLELVGHQRYSYLNGGIHSWKNEGYPVESKIPQVQATRFIAQMNFDERAELDEVLASIDDPDSVIWDARSAEEYAGIRPGALRNGHIPGAVNLDWLQTMDRERNLRLLPMETLRSVLAELGISDKKKIITHCQTHHRSGLTWLIGKAMGLPIKAYDGSWSEWGNLPDTPIDS